MTTVTSPDLDAQPPAGIRRIWHWLNTHRGIALAFLLLIVVASLLRLLTYDRFLPYQDYTDESVYYIYAQYGLNFEDPPSLPDKYRLPPVFPYISGIAQILIDRLSTNPWPMLPDYLYVMRSIAVVLGILTMIVICSIGWQLAGPLAGWLAGFIWGLTPIIVENNNYATPDAYYYLFIALSLSTALRAWKTRSPRWLMGSLLLGIVTIFVKYWAVSIVLPFCILALYMLIRQPRQMRSWIGLYAVIALLSMALLFVVVNPFNVGQEAREVETFRTDGIAYVLNLERHFNNWWFAMQPIGAPLFWVVLIGGGLGYLANRRTQAQTIDLGSVALLIVFAVVTTVLASTFSRISLGKMRHALPAAIALMSVWGACVVQISWTVRAWLSATNRASGWKKVIDYAPAVLVVMILLPGYIAENVQNIQNFSREHIVVKLWQWTDVNVPDDGMVLTDYRGDLERTWNRPWSGYNGPKAFDWWFETQEEIVLSTPQEYVDRGILYFMATEHDLEEGWLSSPEMHVWVEQLTLVKTIPADPDTTAGTTAYFYRMVPPQIEADFDFGGEIRLVGYDLPESALSAGDTLYFRPYWRIIDVPRTNYSMFVHLYPAEEDIQITQHDGPPTTLTRLTSTWDDPEELYIGADVQIVLPDDLPAGDYRLAIGIYDYTTGERLTSPEGADRFLIPVVVD